MISLAFEPLARLYNRPARNSRRLMPVPKLSQRMLPAGPPSMEGAESVTIALHGSMTADVSVGSKAAFRHPGCLLPVQHRKRT